MENYEQKYKSALEWMRSIYPTMQGADKEEELTEFEKELEKFRTHILTTSGEKYDKNGECVIKNVSNKLLDLARKELQPDFDEEMERMLAETDKVVYQKGQQDALKDLPKWKKATENKDFKRPGLLLEDDRVVIASCVYENEYYIELNDLMTLPKEE